MTKKDLPKLKKILSKPHGILCNDEYRNSAVLVPIFFRDDEYHFVFEKRNANIRQGDEICFPGGLHDETKDNSPLDTAMREAHEELGITHDKIEIVDRLDTQVSFSGAIIDAFLAVFHINSTDELNANPDEVQTVFSVPVSYFVDNQPEKHHISIVMSPTETDANGNKKIIFPAKDLGLPERYHQSWTQKIPLYVYPTDHGGLWGITVRFVCDIVKKLLKIK